MNWKGRSDGTNWRIKQQPHLWTFEKQSKQSPAAYVRSGPLIFSISDASRPSFSVMLTTAISQSKEGSINATQEKEDSDEWLNVDAQDFDDMLEKTMGTSRSNKLGPPEAMDVDNPEGETEEDRAAKAQASRLQDLAQKVESFVEGEGDVEGAKFEE